MKKIKRNHDNVKIISVHFCSVDKQGIGNPIECKNHQRPAKRKAKVIFIGKTE